MTILQAAALGIAQGLTEFLPVSSSAHLVLVPHFLGWSEPSVAFDVFLHLATTTALIIFFWNDIIDLLKAWVASVVSRGRSKSSESRLAWLIIIGTIPAALAGVLFKEFLEGLFSSPLRVSALLLVTGIFLWGSEKLSKQEKGLPELNLLDSLTVGVAQALAIAPGISRSGATIASARVRGFSREAAARYSFLLAIPITLGAGLSKLPELKAGGPLHWPDFLVGFLTSVVFGYLAIKYFLAYLRKGKLYVFAYYCWIVGASSILWMLLSR